jgi:hypothetical protein
MFRVITEMAYSALLVISVAIATPTHTAAQDTMTKELWPELDVWVRFSPEWRFSMFIPVTRNIETSYREGNVNYQVDRIWGKVNEHQKLRIRDDNRSLVLRLNMVRVGYLRGRSLDDEGVNYSETACYLEYHRRIPINNVALVNNRLRNDFRFLGDDGAFSYRVRYRLEIEREFQLKKLSFVPFLKGEMGYDSRFETINRYRFTTGSSVAFASMYTFEVNVNYQYDTRASVSRLFSLGLVLNIFFEI